MITGICDEHVSRNPPQRLPRTVAPPWPARRRRNSRSTRQYHDARHNVETACSLAPVDHGFHRFASRTFAQTGELQRAAELVANLHPGERYGAAIGLTLFHLVRAEWDTAAEWAVKVCEERDPRLIFVVALLRAASPNVLKSNSRWSALVKTMHIPPEL